jgi:hypothetical protein
LNLNSESETCACSYRPVPGKLDILDMEILKAKWEARLSYFHADTWVAFLLRAGTTRKPFAYIAHLVIPEILAKSTIFTDKEHSKGMSLSKTKHNQKQNKGKAITAFSQAS